MLDQLREHGSEILSRADAGPVARTRCGQSSFTIVSPGKTACKSRFWPFSIQIVLASTMHYHADLEWVRTAFRNFSRTVVSATWEADTGLARPGLVTDAGGQGSRLGFPSRKASLGIPLPRREAEPRKNIWRILFFSCAAAAPTAGHESAGTPPRRGSPGQRNPHLPYCDADQGSDLEQLQPNRGALRFREFGSRQSQSPQHL